MRALVVVACFVGVLARNQRAWAEPATEPVAAGEDAKTLPPIEIGIGGFAQMDFGTICRRDSDVIDCSTALAFAGIVLEPRWRVSPLVSVGTIAAVGWSPSREGTMGSDGSHTDFGLMTWHLEAEARWHPLGASGVDPWLGIDMGFAALRDSAEIFGPGGGRVGAVSTTQFAPAGGAAVGVDFTDASFLALGIELRAAVQSFGHQPPMLDAALGLNARDVGTLGAISLLLSGTFRPAP